MKQTAKQRSNSKGPKKFFLTWDAYLHMIENVGEKIKKENLALTYIYGIPRGGLIPATILSHYLDVELITETPLLARVPDLRLGDSVLIVDDIVDTFKSMKGAILGWNGAKVYTASLYKHQKCKWKPDFYFGENSDWIVFPYEKE